MMTGMQSSSLGFDGLSVYYYNRFVCVGVSNVGSGVSYIGSGRTANAYKHLHTQEAALEKNASVSGRCPGEAADLKRKIN